MKDTVSQYVPPHSPLTSTEPQVFSNNLTMPAARHYGCGVRTCEPFDPESKGGAEHTVKIAKADLVPTETNLVANYDSFADLEAACEAWCERVNARPHRATGQPPVERLMREGPRLHVLPDTVRDSRVNHATRRSASIAACAKASTKWLFPVPPRYFDTISRIWEPSSELAKTIVTGLYPSWDISQVGINAAYEFLAAEMDKALRRLVREGQADVIRALAARKFETHANEDSHQ